MSIHMLVSGIHTSGALVTSPPLALPARNASTAEASALVTFTCTHGSAMPSATALTAV